MKKIWLLFILGLFLVACTFQCTFQVEEYKDPNWPRVIVREKQGEVIKEKTQKAEKKEVKGYERKNKGKEC